MEEKVQNIRKQLLEFKEQSYSMCISSSFQTHSIPLLHIVSNTIPNIPVLFLDTGFHFPETYEFKDSIEKQLNLNIINLKSGTSKMEQTDKHGHFLYMSDPDYCCHMNKTVPLDEALESYDVWIAGLRKDQTNFRKNLSPVTQRKEGKLKYHPILDWNAKLIYQYRKKYDLPEHPLEEKGYLSVGCKLCTMTYSETGERSGRWHGMKKTECGIHLNN